RGALFFWLVSAHHLGDVGSILFECHPGRNGHRGGAKKGGAETGGTEQFGFFQSPPRTAVRLSCAEIRRLFWQLVLVAERSAEAIVYVMQTDCGWRNLPKSFPPWQTVYTQLREWHKTGIWGKIWSGLDQPHPTDELQL